MGKSQRLRLSDVRGVFRLLGECRELGDDSLEWRRHLLTRLCHSIGSSVGITTEAGLADPRWPMKLQEPVDVGFTDSAERAVWLEFQRNPDNFRNPLLSRILALPTRLSTLTREQVVEDRVWYRCAAFNDYFRRANHDDGLWSRLRLPGLNHVHMVTLHRRVGDRGFGPRDRRLLHLLHLELGPLLGTALAPAGEPGPAGLPPRSRQTLESLLRGDSEKETARRLGLSVHTVHEYVTALYRHFGVCSRAELLARFVRRFRLRGR
jgi:DNA-binding CsgD family transcriptional regulator